ncbi:hypothetical protein [Burkholderia anthina]|uniref:hypothetical protein n=1 Tax=Burkholderia anthina TaxID=179879 RepID=UPI00158A72F8|nr:hypothetical protein [Burkholderia anthina]
MTIFERPDEDVFADGARPGEVDDFPNVARGWGVALDQTGGKPPMEWFNWLGRRIDRAIRYFMQRGLAEWSATETYPVGAVVQHNGIIYRADVENEGRAPDGSPGQWGAPWAPTVDVDDSSNRVVNTELLAAALKTVQPALGFIPVRQGGGANQGKNVVRIGWAQDGSGLLASVDDTNLGAIAFAKDVNGYATQAWVKGYALSRAGDTMTDRLTLSREGWQAELQLQNLRPGQRSSAFIRARDAGGVEIINSAYNGVPWQASNEGETFQPGTAHVGGASFQADGNVWGAAWGNDFLSNVVGRKAVAGARVQHDSGLAEFDYVGSVSSNVHGQVDLPAPWVVAGLRVNADNRSVTAIWQRGVVLRNQ